MLFSHGGHEVIFQIVQLVELQVGPGQLVDLRIELGVHLSQLLLHGHEVPQHAIERLAELLELIARADLGPPVEMAAGDRIADFPQVFDRLDDHVTNNGPRGGHGQEHRNNGGRQQNGIVPRQRAVILRDRQHNGRHPHQSPHFHRFGANGAVVMALEADLAGADGTVVPHFAAPGLVADDTIRFTEFGIGLQQIQLGEIGLVAGNLLGIDGVCPVEGPEKSVVFLAMQFWGEQRFPESVVGFAEVLGGQADMGPVVPLDNRLDHHPACQQVLVEHQARSHPVVEIKAARDEQQ